MLNHNKCPLCGSGDIILLYECTDYLVSRERFPVYRCRSCTFIFTNNIPEEKEAARYYQSEEYISHSDNNNGLINSIYQYVRRWMLSSKLRMLKKESGLVKASVLDIGSGSGYFPAYLINKGWECQGIEISKEARHYAGERNNIGLKPPEDINNFENNSIDIVTMWHTLEHFYQPGEYLGSSYRILRDKGLLVIALPNHQSYDARKYREEWAAWDVPRHLWHHNIDTIKLLCDKYGFKLKSIYRLPFDAYYVSALTEKNKKSSIPLIKGFTTGFISWISSILIKRNTSSLVYIFRKD